MRLTRILLIIVAVVCFGVALSYPIRYRLAQNENNSNMEELSAMRAKIQQNETDADETTAEGTPASEGASGMEADGDAEDAEGARRDTGAEEANGDDIEEDAEDEAGEDEDDVPLMPKRPTLAPDSDAPAAQATPTDGETTQAVEPRAASKPEDEAAEPTTGEPASSELIPGEPASGEPAVEPRAAEPEAGPGEEPPEAVETAVPEPTPEPTPEGTPVPNPDLELLLLDGFVTPSPTPRVTPVPQDYVTPEPSPTPVWDEYTGPLPYPMLEKIELDKSKMLPELREIYALNNDLVGWIAIPGTVIDYPVVQSKDSDYYLEHDFYGNANINGQIILDTLCDPYTPSYNLILSGHHMKNGSMFGDLPEYRNKNYWEKHKLVEFDTLMFRKQYVIFACFYSADYDEDEEGFRYNADIQYNMEAKKWLREIEMNKLYDTEIDVRFGDEFITLTTCNRARHRNGRFVVVARKVREGETIE